VVAAAALSLICARSCANSSAACRGRTKTRPASGGRPTKGDTIRGKYGAPGVGGTGAADRPSEAVG